MKRINTNRASHAAGFIGMAQHLLDLSIEHAKTRVQYGRPIGDFRQFSICSQIWRRKSMQQNAWSMMWLIKLIREKRIRPVRPWPSCLLQR
ncbi:hypothetical protein KEH51_22810 [[Brevibacterium] frigoritolerans]|uniref:Acyl-CoA dehydrogenase/oxidase C-terminal domain-containing protein n=1 Tax=Peribacillus frigoritolerans TaxID=450367 RepID=A0A941FTE4_9BACI|nr:hypothetical protein [Peribacillus frigoritolerans]